jgi:hypothetical protein
MLRRRFAVTDRRFGTNSPGQADQEALFLICLNFEDGTDMLSRNVGKVATNLPCVTPQKSEDLYWERRYFITSISIYFLIPLLCNIP